MKNVLLLVHDDPGQESRLQAALDLVRALDGHLICLDVLAIPVVSGELYALSVESALIMGERARESENREALQRRMSHEDVPWTWVEVSGEFAAAIKEAASTADIIVLNRQLDSTLWPDMRSIASEVVTGSGKTIVAVPQDVRGIQVSGRALVAWDGSDEAMKAVQSAVPLLRLAEAVTIIEIEEGSIKLPAEEAAAYLSRHDIKARIERRKPGVLSIVDAILAEAKASGAGYVVMGGFGHGRLIEAVFSGVSREMLTDSPMPIVMAH